MSNRPRFGRRQRPTRLRNDTSRPEAEPEEVLDVHSVHDSSDEEVACTSATLVMPARSKSSQTPVRHGKHASAAPLAGGSGLKQRGTQKSQRDPEEVIEISTDGSVQHEDEDADVLDFEDVDVSTSTNGIARAVQPGSTNATEDQDEDLEMEDVDPETARSEDSARVLEDMYAAAYREALATAVDRDEEADDDDASEDRSAVPIYKDGKGQHKGVEISMGSRSKKQETDAAKKKSTNFLTPRDRQNRITAHKLYVLSMLAHTKVRNKWCNDPELRDALIDMVPDYMITKLRSIHPKKVTEQRERIRMFESFLFELVHWWAGRFRLDPDMTAKSALRQPDQDIAAGILPAPGRRIDGWIVETAAEREERHRKERKAQLRRQKDKEMEAQRSIKSKGKAKMEASTSESVSSASAPRKTTEITIFAPGSAIRPIYLRLLPSAENISSVSDLTRRAIERSGSRETSAQLFCALCRSLGIPARLVISPQPMPWSVGASKLANTAQPVSQANKKPSKLRSKTKGGLPRNFASKPLDEFTSDEEEDDEEYDSTRRHSGTSTPGKASSRAGSVPSSAGSLTDSSVEEVKVASSSNRSKRTDPDLAKKAVLGAAASSNRSRAAVIAANGNRAKTKRGDQNTRVAPEDALSDASSRSANSKGKGKAKAINLDSEGEASPGDDDGDNDYRPEKWKNLKAPLKVEPKVKLRAFRPKQLKASEVAALDDDTADPVDLQAPPTMWVEVFSKPYQKWISVDPIRQLVRPTGNRLMEPSPTDRQNKLIYVVAFEEDGYARDVTARYTKTLNSRVSRLRPPTRVKGEEDWWSKVARAMHRPQKFDRDAMEDAELRDNSSREPMPSSVAGFKDHPIYFLEKFLKRDEVVFPRRQIATFQGAPVFSKSDVLTLRSSRQWYNEGRVVKDGEIALKWVKSRGYTLANKRAEEQARLEGREVAQEGLYAEFQTKLYVPPPVGPSGEIPTNGFGNIDLFVPTMLPAGAAHLPFSGVAKVAKKLGVPYAEAITGFEFRKQRGMPKITGIVVAQQSAELVEEAFWQQEHEDAMKQQTKKMERAMKNWRKLINALKIAKRVKEQYRDKMTTDTPQKSSASTTKAKVKGGEETTTSKYFSSSQERQNAAASTSEAPRTEHDLAVQEAEAEDLTLATGDDATEEAGVDPVVEVSASTETTPSKKRKIISLAQLAATTDGGGDQRDVLSSDSEVETNVVIAEDPVDDKSPSKRRRRTGPATETPSASHAEAATPTRRVRSARGSTTANISQPPADTASKGGSGSGRSTRASTRTRSSGRKSYVEVSGSEPEPDDEDDDPSKQEDDDEAMHAEPDRSSPTDDAEPAASSIVNGGRRTTTTRPRITVKLNTRSSRRTSGRR